VHIVLDGSFQPGKSAILVPRTDDGRVIFAIPWNNRIVIGTTDIPMEGPLLEPSPTDEEINYLLKYAGKYLTGNPTRADVRSAWAGIRPLVSTNPEDDTADISRDHTLITDPSGLVTITGGKWTTYRLMGEDAVDMAIKNGKLETKASVSKTLKLHGWSRNNEPDAPYGNYGTDAAILHELGDQYGTEPFHPDLPCTPAQVIFAVRHEMARTLEDVLARRTRCLLLDAETTLKIAGPVAQLMAQEFEKNNGWIEEQVKIFEKLAKGYVVE
jgi:glycerol-3-phosphate dehydrogenase